MNPFSESLFSQSNPCIPCCVEPVECECALFIPYFNGVYGSLADAENALDNYTAGCRAYLGVAATPPVSFSADFSTPNSADVSVHATTGNAIPDFIDVYFSITVVEGTSISIPFIMTTDGGIGSTGASAYLYNCADATTVMEDTESGVASGTLNLNSIPTGTYILQLQGFTFLSTDTTFAFTAMGDTTTLFNPVIALWDDSGTVRQLDACPKLFIPPLTEGNDEWYENQSAAQDAIDAQTSNCVGFIHDVTITTGTVFTATDGGSTLELDVFYNFTAGGSAEMEGSVNAEAGQTLTISWTSTDALSTTIAIYDRNADLVQSWTGQPTSGSVTSAALPYTGKYIVDVFVSGDPMQPSFDATFTISSSGTMTVNPVQALYDVGLDCPARLDC